MLSAFRLDSGEFLDGLLTRSLAALMEEGLITLDEVITDGTKIRAAASRSSMRRRKTLTELEAKARSRVAELRQELEVDSAAGGRRLSKRRLSAAEDRARRVAAALAKHPATAPKEAEKDQTEGDEPPAGGKSSKKPKEERVSTTDPDAPLMRMADGAVRPAYNVQVTSACGFVVAIEPMQRRNDRGLAQAMVAQVERRCGKPPSRLLADVGAMTAVDIVGFADTHPAMEVFSPPPARKETSKPESKARYERNRAAEPQCLKDWRARMESEVGQAVYKRRSNTEHVHARIKNRGFGRMVVRGLRKVHIVCMLHAIAHNLIWAISRRAAQPA
jgi:hypothetical protein